MQSNDQEYPSLSSIGFSREVLFVDLETSGLNPPKAVTLSIGAVLMNTTGNIKSTFYMVICPTADQILNIDQKALSVNGFTIERLREEGVPQEMVWSAFSGWLRATGVTSHTRYVGQNPGFDLSFIGAEAPDLIKKYGWVPERVYDIIEYYNVAQSKFIVPFISDTRKGKSGNNIAKNLGVEPEPDIHNALQGALLNYRNFTRLAQIDKRYRDALK